MTASASWQAQVKVSGAAVVFTGDATTFVSGKTYQLTNTSHRIVDPATAVVVKDNAVTVAAANILSFDYLFGQVTFVAGYTVTGPVTIDGAYLPTQSVTEAKSVDFTVTINVLDMSSMGVANKQKLAGLIDWTGSIGRLALPLDDLDSVTGGVQSLELWRSTGTPRLIDVLFVTGTRVRGWALIKGYKVAAQLEGIIECTVDLEGASQAAGASFGIGT